MSNNLAVYDPDDAATRLEPNVSVAAGFNPRSVSAKIVDAVKQGQWRMVWNWKINVITRHD